MGRPDGGKYRLADGSLVPSVTVVIGQNLGWKTDALCSWANRLGLEGKNWRTVRDKAGDVGSCAHAMIEADLLGTKPDLAEFSFNTVEAAAIPYATFCDWHATSGFTPDILEQAIVSETYRTGGTPDAIGRMNGSSVLLDWKTSTGIYEDHVIQLAAYWQIAEEAHGLTIDEAQCVRFGKDGSLQVKKYTWPDLEPAWEVFKLLRDLHNYKRQICGR